MPFRRPNIHIDYNSIEIERVPTNIIEIANTKMKKNSSDNSTTSDAIMLQKRNVASDVASAITY